MFNKDTLKHLPVPGVFAAMKSQAIDHTVDDIRRNLPLPAGGSFNSAISISAGVLSGMCFIGGLCLLVGFIFESSWAFLIGPLVSWGGYMGIPILGEIIDEKTEAKKRFLHWRANQQEHIIVIYLEGLITQLQAQLQEDSGLLPQLINYLQAGQGRVDAAFEQIGANKLEDDELVSGRSALQSRAEILRHQLRQFDLLQKAKLADVETLHTQLLVLSELMSGREDLENRERRLVQHGIQGTSLLEEFDKVAFEMSAQILREINKLREALKNVRVIKDKMFAQDDPELADREALNRLEGALNADSARIEEGFARLRSRAEVLGQPQHVEIE